MAGRFALTAALSVAAALVVAACVQRETSGERLTVQAEWQPWLDHAEPHMVVQVSNVGDEMARIGPGGHELRISGPEGMVPMDWGAEDFARTLMPGHGVTIPLHPHMGDGGMMMAMDHGSGMVTAPMPGDYMVCVGTSCAGATLEPGGVE